MRRLRVTWLFVVLVVSGPAIWLLLGERGGRERIVPLASLDLLKVEQGLGYAQPNRTIQGRPFSIAGETYASGLGTHAPSVVRVALDGRGSRFTAKVGVDDEAKRPGSVVFRIIGDERERYNSGTVRAGEPARPVDVDLRGIRRLLLLVEPGVDGQDGDHADWVDALFRVKGERPRTVDRPTEEAILLTPPSSPRPCINGARIFGVGPGSPLLYTIAATGDRPMTFGVTNLPAGLQLDSQTGQITGSLSKVGTNRMTLVAENELGRAERELRIVVGVSLALTPPMGWNSWNCWGCAVDQEKILETAQAFVDSGLIEHGWSYINIDDCWTVNPSAADGVVRDRQGMLQANDKFPDMLRLTDAIHSLGLKAGIYTSPGPTTCQGFTGSYQHEMQDAARIARWGFDYLKYDWCGYSAIVGDPDREALIKPYALMKSCLDQVERDIVYSLCQYGMGEVWEWGRDAGGHCWRTTGDIVDTWESVSSIGFSQDGYSLFGGPGHWNDPDMLVVGQVGWGSDLHATRLTPNEQYSHMSLWCLLCAPLLIGCDVTKLDAFTHSLLTNDEVLEVNQDPLGDQARRIARAGYQEVWAKAMEDGSKAVGLFNRSEFPERITVQWKDLGIHGPHRVRDLWRQQDLGEFEDHFEDKVPRHGVLLVRMNGIGTGD